MPVLKRIIAITASILTLATTGMSQEVGITPDMMSVEYTISGVTYKVERNQDQNAEVSRFFAKTSRACPPFCVQPLFVNDEVETVGELELLTFLVEYVSAGKGFLIDSRTPDFYAKGTIPGAANLPHNLFIPNADNVFFESTMMMLSGTKNGSGEWVFNNPPDLMLFCNGPWCDQSPSAIRNLQAINYPVEKLHYYRGGMQSWENMGFSVQIP